VVQKVDVEFYVCNKVARKMYNIKFANAQHAQVTYNFKYAKVLDE
jgi:hypothetical protein